MNDDIEEKRTIKNSVYFENPEKFAQIFCNAAETQKSIDNALNNNFISLIKNNKEAIAQIKTLQREVNAEDWKVLGSKFMIMAGSVSLLFIGAIISKYFGTH